MTARIIHGDCLDVLRTLPDCSVDAVVTDPPYGLSFMGRKWDYDVPSVEVWAECLRVLKPGGHLLAFAGTRTQHRMAVRIEDAGFEIRDMIAWVYGSGFPKSLDVSKAIDARAGAEREVVGDKLDRRGYHLHGHDGGEAFGHGIASSTPETRLRAALITDPATDAARQWQGWGTALKPALEPITVARKPLSGTVADNVLAHGTGALNVDGCRIQTAEDDLAAMAGRSGAGKGRTSFHAIGRESGTFVPNSTGRWPANLIHDGSEEVLAGFPQAPGQQCAVGPQYGDRASVNAYGDFWPRPLFEPRADTGSAARFFYCAKASRVDREEGLDRFESRETSLKYNGGAGFAGRTLVDGEWVNTDKGNRRRPRNHHPTVKPTDLMRYLCRLVTPPGGTVLDPFAGSGSTGKGAVLEGFSFVGIERESEYVDIARARIAHAEIVARTPPSAAPGKANRDTGDDAQLGLFGKVENAA